MLRRVALLAGVSLIALAPSAAHAIDGVWIGSGAEWTNGTNWSSTPDVPDNAATFTNNGAPTSATISDDASINTIQFTAGAPAFNFVTSGTGITFDINGAGIVNNSAFAPSFTNNDNLNFNNTSSAGNAVITNNNGGVLSFNNNSTAANAIIITNGGALTQFNDNSTGGNAVITNNNGGVLSFNNNSTAANAIIITNGGALTQFNDNSTGGNAQSIANAGGVVDFSNTAGPAKDGNVSAGSIAGAGNYFLGSNQLTVGSNNLSTTVSGVISDCGATGFECSAGSGTTGGGLTKIGSGTLTLTGASTYTGDTNVNEGVLNVTGSLVSAVTVNSGGMLTGTGTIGGLSVGSGGIVAPGNSIGTLRVAGDVSFDEGSIYQVKANAAGKSAMISATGAASIDGGTVQVLAQSGTYARQTRYTILTASGGVDGQFTDVTSNLAFLTPLLSSDPNNIFLTLVRNDITFASVAQTPNQRAVAAALDSSSPLKPLVQAVANLTLAGTLQAFDALSGEVHGSVQTTMIDDSRYIRQAVLGRLRQAPYAGADSAMAALGSGGPILAYADPAAGGGLAYRDGDRPNEAINQLFGAPLQSPDLTFWAQGVGAWGRVNSDGNAADVARNLGGIFTGFDGRFGEWRAGLASGYTNASTTVSARASSANIDSAYFAGYGGTSFGPLNFRSGAVLAWHTIGTSRSIAFPGFSEQASARYSAVEGQVFGEIGYGMSFGDIAVEPFAGLAWVYLNTESFNETGGLGALGASSTENDVNYSTLGARWASTYLMPNGMIFLPRASLAWQHAFGTVTPSALLTFQNTGVPFGILGAPIARDAALVEAGGDLQLGPQTKVGVAYFGQLASNARDHSVKANFSWRF
jgi:fibronectin-binding autotransporter adhesin